MTTSPKQDPRSSIVDQYFKYIRELRTGVDGAVDRLMSLWDADGSFEFAGTPPVTGIYHGGVAIRTLYNNRFNQSNMRLTLEGAAIKGMRAAGQKQREVALGVVDTEVHRVRAMDDKLVAGWTTTIGTNEKLGFQVSGSHTFTFKGDKIASVRIVMSPKPDAAPGFRLEDLSVSDIGRLALAAWPVV